jgi:hypothetical protein
MSKEHRYPLNGRLGGPTAGLEAVEMKYASKIKLYLQGVKWDE